MAGDHGVAEEGVSAFPQAVTGQMLLNFARGGAAINAIARSVGAELMVVNVGTIASTPNGVRERVIAQGTRNIAIGPAMSLEESARAFEVGVTLANELAEAGFTIVALGEMGIANTTSAAALAHVFTQADIKDVVGRGTGVNDAQLERKREVVWRALQVNRPEASKPHETLAALGGFEIAALAGLTVGAASRRMAIVLDGFIASTAALVASKLCPQVGGYLFGSHCSSEPGHRAVLRELDLTELFDLGMRLGEGTGAALSLPWFNAAVAVLTQMATFASAGVSNRDA
jgi:nicotinate-nucleotide--dimethylbenzimidazole phosphoribosyltransferase